MNKNYVMLIFLLCYKMCTSSGNVRQMKDKDLDDVACMIMRAIASTKRYSYAQKYEVLEEFYAPNEIQNRFFNPETIALVLEYDDKIVGTAKLRAESAEDVTLSGMYVDPLVTNLELTKMAGKKSNKNLELNKEFRIKMAREALKVARDKKFKRVSTLAMVGGESFYQKLGFQKIGIPFYPTEGGHQHQMLQFYL